jgi:hypothetical protein
MKTNKGTTIYNNECHCINIISNIYGDSSIAIDVGATKKEHKGMCDTCLSMR